MKLKLLVILFSYFTCAFSLDNSFKIFRICVHGEKIISPRKINFVIEELISKAENDTEAEAEVEVEVDEM